MVVIVRHAVIADRAVVHPFLAVDLTLLAVPPLDQKGARLGMHYRVTGRSFLDNWVLAGIDWGLLGSVVCWDLAQVETYISSSTGDGTEGLDKVLGSLAALEESAGCPAMEFVLTCLHNSRWESLASRQSA